MRLLVTIGVATLLVAASASQQLTAIRASNAVELQAALARAKPGDTILLRPGVEYLGNFTLPSRTDQASGIITLRTDGAGLPGPGTRTGPQFAGKLAILRSESRDPALRAAAGAHHWRIENVEFGPNRNGEGDIIALGSGGRDQNDRAAVPHDIVLDRVLVRGDPTAGQRRGIALNSASTSILNSHLADIKAAGVEAQAICGWNGPGPFIIENNYIEAAGENVMFGGADPWIDGLVPSDITIRRNHITRPAQWKGTPWTVKNLLELKNAERVVIADNLFEHHWPQAQSGYAILFTPRNQDGRAPWSRVARVQFTGNVVRHVSAGINISGLDDVRGSERTTDISIERNLFADVGGEWGAPGDFVQVGNGPVNVRIERNTALQTGRTLLVYGSKHGREVPGFVFKSNVVRHNRFGLLGDSVGTGNPAIARYFPDGVVTGNVFAGGQSSAYPGGNKFESAEALRTEADAARFTGAGADLAALSTTEQVAREGRRPDTK